MRDSQLPVHGKEATRPKPVIIHFGGQESCALAVGPAGSASTIKTETAGAVMVNRMRVAPVATAGSAVREEDPP